MPKTRTLFLVDHFLTPHVKITDGGILCEGNKIIGIGGASAFSFYETGLSVIDLKDTYALPGLIDSHVHGGGLFETSRALEEGQDMEKMSSFLAKHGVTAFLPALQTDEAGKMLKTVGKLATLIGNRCEGAAPCGIHLDGPFVNPDMAVLHKREYTSAVDLGYASELIASGGGRIKVMTFSPELKNCEKFISLMLENGVIPSMGHSCADEETTLRAVECGARRCTDFFSGYPALCHRKSSITDVALTDDRISLEIIADGSGICRRMIDLVMRAKPRKNIIAVSDSFTTGDGVKVFSALDRAWCNMRHYPNIPETVGAAVFTSNPAEDIGLVTRGELSPGKRADIVFFDVRDNSVRMTIADGNIVYKAPEKESLSL